MAIVTDRQVRRLHALLKTGKPLLVAAMRTDMDRKTARKYRDQAKLPAPTKTAMMWINARTPLFCPR